MDSEKFRLETQQKINKMFECIVWCSSKLDEQQEQFISVMEDNRLEIVKRSEKLKKMIDQHTASLLEELESVENRRIHEIYNKNMEFKEHHSELIRLQKSYADNNYNYCQSVNEISRNSLTLQKMTFMTLNLKNSINLFVCVYFKVTGIEEFMRKDNDNIVGKLEGWFILNY